MREYQVRAVVVRVARRCRLRLPACEVEQIDGSAWWVVRLVSSCPSSWPAWRQFGVALRVEFAASSVEVVGWVVKRRTVSVCAHLGRLAGVPPCWREAAKRAATERPSPVRSQRVRTRPRT
jgi:hypothetical protein